jgi:cytochrome c oxidase cbb3-type subunit 4
VIAMTLNDLRIAVTLLSFAAFVGILIWAWSARNRASFERDALLPFQEEDRHE